MEPNRVEDSLQQIRITNCSFEGNVGGGIMMGAQNSFFAPF
jgi:hypothetical protein